MEFSKIIEEEKDEIHKKGILLKSYLSEKYKKLSKKERAKIEEALESDPSIVLEGDAFKLISITSTTEQELLDQINSLEKTELYQDKIKVANVIYRGIIIVANPLLAVPDFINKLYQGRSNLITSIHISPESTMNVVHHLTYELEVTEKEINRLAFEGRISGKEITELESKRKFIKEKIERLTSEELMPFKLNLIFAIEEINDEDLDFATNKILTYLRKLGFIVKSAINYQKDALKTIVPSGADFLRRKPIIVTNDLLSNIFPFVKR
ncbi:MAG: hypothetical protein AABX63_02360 [Nanoarchaeota archaeon]